MASSNSIKPNIILAYVTRHDPTAAAGRTANDAWMQYLNDQIGGAPSTIKRRDLERSWLQGLGATGGTLSDLWASYLPGVATITHSTELTEHIRNFFLQG